MMFVAERNRLIKVETDTTGPVCPRSKPPPCHSSHHNEDNREQPYAACQSVLRFEDGGQCLRSPL